MKKLAILLFIASCSFKPQIGPPWAQDLLDRGPKTKSAKFQEGWHDGCKTGMSVTANTFLRQFYRFTQNSELQMDREYYTGWKTAYTYCHRYVFQYLRREYF